MENRLKEFRRASGLTQEQLANMIGVSQGAVQKLENGVVDLDLKWMDLLSKALNVKPYELLPEEWQPPKLSEQDTKLLQAFKAMATASTGDSLNKNISEQNKERS